MKIVDNREISKERNDSILDLSACSSVNFVGIGQLRIQNSKTKFDD
jgi:hypothetical protein